MREIHFRTHFPADGKLRLKLPEEFRNRVVSVTIEAVPPDAPCEPYADTYLVKEPTSE